jgi:hypothetical protein
VFRIYNQFAKETPKDSKPKKKQSNPGAANANFIWEISRATLVAHTYFKPIIIGADYFSDDGVRYNNPSEKVCYEVIYKEEERRNSNSIDLFQTMIPRCETLELNWSTIVERHIATHPLHRPRIDGGPF